MVFLVVDDHISSAWVRDGGALEAAYAQDIDAHDQKGLWRHSLDPKHEQRMPTEYRSWERWSDRLDKESEAHVFAFDMNSDCTNCGNSAWDMIDTPHLKAVQCRSCGHTPTECGSSRFASSSYSTYTNCSRPSVPYGYPESEGSEADSETLPPVPLLEEDEESVPSEVEGIAERDFGAMPRVIPRTANRHSGIRSVRQSMIQPTRQPRWFEAKQNITFQFKLTPRARAGAGAAPATAIPKANEDGSSGPAPSTGSAESTSSQPPGRTPADQRSTRGINVHELGNDHTAWQRLLTSALFLIKEDNMPMQPGESKVLNLGLSSSRQSGGKHLAMRHESSKEHEVNVQSSTDPAKRIRWRVVVKPVRRQQNERGSLLPR